MTMKALVMERYKEFVYKDVPTPTPGEGEVLVRVKACAVCGSDVHGMDGSTGRRCPPVIMGHEASGQIEAVGSGVKEYKPGDRVTFDSTIYCNKCERCRAGLVNLCATRRVLGVSCEDYRMDGAFAEYVVVPEYVLYRLPDNDPSAGRHGGATGYCLPRGHPHPHYAGHERGGGGRGHHRHAHHAGGTEHGGKDPHCRGY